MRVLLCALMLASLIPAQTPVMLSPYEATEGWIVLFDGESLFGWSKDGTAEWRVADGVLTSDSGGEGWLRTNSFFGDYVLKCEFRTNGNQLPIGGRAGVSDGHWHSYEVSVSGGRILESVAGKQRGARKRKEIGGPVRLFHPKGSSVEYRNVRLKPLGVKPLFDGNSLAGWRKVDAPKPPAEPPEWSVRDGSIHVERGPGELQSESQFADFVLQLDVRANAPDRQHHPNSGVFFRGIPGGFWTGYEAQIRNEWENGGRTKPVDFGTGGIYHYQPARRVVSADGHFFTMTIVARARHLAVWVDGYPVSDWDDPHPAGDNVRKGEARLAAGTIGLQAHDPTTNLDFRHIRAVELPPGPKQDKAADGQGAKSR